MHQDLKWTISGGQHGLLDQAGVDVDVVRGSGRQNGLHQAILSVILSAQAVLFQGLLDDGLHVVLDGEEECFVRDVAVDGLTEDFQRAAGVRAAVLALVELQFFLELLLPATTHHGFRVGDAAVEARFRELFEEFLRVVRLGRADLP